MSYPLYYGYVFDVSSYLDFTLFKQRSPPQITFVFNVIVTCELPILVNHHHTSHHNHTHSKHKHLACLTLVRFVVVV